MAGQILFEQQCASCHNAGAQFRDIDALVSDGTLVQVIERTMPPRSPDRCEDACAEDTAAYIEAVFATPASASSSSSSSSNSSSSGGILLGNLANGGTIFEAQCKICHADGAQFTDIDSLDLVPQALFDKINNTMPPDDAALCDGQCAADVAEYVRRNFKTPEGPDTPLEKVALAPQVYVRKAKTLLTGQAMTQAELETVNADPNALAPMIKSWQQSDAYEEKLTWFLTEYLQDMFDFGNFDRRAIAGQVRGFTNASLMFRFINPLVWDNIETYSVKTYLDLIVNAEEPFTNITSQSEWMLTPAMMSLYLAMDQPNFAPDDEDFTLSANPSSLADEDTPMAEQIASKAFYFPKPEGTSFRTFLTSRNPDRERYVGNDVGTVWGYLNEFSTHTPDDSKKLFIDSDYTNWKRVKIVQRGPNDPDVKFWDLPTIRSTNTLYLRAPRVGFFTSPNFFTRWETNRDNQWRVNVNQTLIVALNQSFVPNNTSVSLNDESLSDDHAIPGTDCYGCHKLVDPIRNYFQTWYDDLYAKPRETKLAGIENTPAFSFQGFTDQGTQLEDLGRALATHPAFATGWVQKLCYYANSKACYEKDPDFIAVAQAFKASGFNFNQLIETFFSSKLITSDVIEQSDRVDADFGSISRRQHLCQTLKQRLSAVAGREIEVCEINPRRNVLGTLANALPREEWTRGALNPAQPTRPDLFYQTTVENICQSVADTYYDSTAFPASDIDTFLDDYLLPDILALPSNDTRYASFRSVLLDHYNAASERTSDNEALLSSVFSLACSSPLLSSVDF